MPSYDVVLVPTDGSPPAVRGVEHGLAIAESHDAAVHFCHVIDRRRYGDRTGFSSYELAIERCEDEANGELDALVQRATERGLDAESHCTRGLPHEEIVAIANAVDADVIVMGKHGEGAAESPHIGSIADRVLRTTNRPVLTV